MVIGATNRPQEIDEAARRRLVKRLYIPLPELNARLSIVKSLLSDKNPLSESDLERIGQLSEGWFAHVFLSLVLVLTLVLVLVLFLGSIGYSGSDMYAACREAALGPLRCIQDIRSIEASQASPSLSLSFVSSFHSYALAIGLVLVRHANVSRP